MSYTRYFHSSSHRSSSTSSIDISSSLSSTTHHISSSNQSFNPRHIHLRSPNPWERRSHEVHSWNKDLIRYTVKQPEADPHARFLHRSMDSCPSGLSERQRNKWLKTGNKARQNKEFLSNTDHFHWPTSYYTPPIHIHYKTPIAILQSLTDTLVDVHLFTIDTESDKPTNRCPHSRPSLLQIQAIYHEYHSMVLLLETQHLPDPSSYAFLRNSIFFRHLTSLTTLIYKNTSLIYGMNNIRIHQNVQNVIYQYLMNMKMMIFLSVW